MELIHLLYIFLIALFSSMAMVPFLMRWAFDTGAIDVPDARKKHKKAVPRIGGVAICMGWLFSLLIYVDMSREVRGILAGTLIIFFTGLIDDLYGLSPKRKFQGQIAACLVTIFVGHISIFTLGNLFGNSTLLLPSWLGIPFTVVTVVGVVNAFNLMDGLDGLAGGISVIALSAFMVLGHLSGNLMLMALCAALLGAVLGFLKFNLYPARIFMGDTGSLVVGFVIAFLAILTTQTPGSGVAPIVVVLILGLPIVDTLRVMGRRILHRKSPFSPDRTHLHHNFLDLGLQHRYTVLAIYGLSIFWATFAVMARNWDDRYLLAAFVLLMMLFYLNMLLLRKVDFFTAFLRKDSQAPIRHSVTYRRFSEFIAATTPVTIFLTLAYLMLATLACSQADIMSLRAGTALLLGCVALIFFTKDLCNHYVLAMTAVAILLIIFIANHDQSRDLIGSLSLAELTNVLLACLSALVLLRFAFRKPGEHILASVDYLVIGLGAFVILVSSQSSIGNDIPETVAKGTILFLALKASSLGGPKPARLVVGGVLAALAGIIIKGYGF
ncbi:MAG: MraY family glycosyltransferase [Geobacteraceae bacterium]|nr:MraY family glycosyltransferase [Geobacteraceae bacterium]